MRAIGIALLLALLIPTSRAASQTEADTAAIRATVMDYIEGWYEADGERMERSLHPQLAKRIVAAAPGGKSRLENLTARALVEDTRTGQKTPAARQRKEVRILDTFQDMATVRLAADGWVDYMHLAKSDGRWVIVNVLWDMTRQTAERS